MSARQWQKYRQANIGVKQVFIIQGAGPINWLICLSIAYCLLSLNGFLFLSFDLPPYAAGGPDNGRNVAYGGMMDHSSTKVIGILYTLH